jgi:5'-methylthioadenosine phosphorylase
MTTCPEVFLAREAEIAYATISHITDYDVWHESEQPVTVEMVMETMRRNVDAVQKTLALAVERLDETADYPAHHALENAVMTAPEKMSPELLQRLAPILGERFKT